MKRRPQVEAFADLMERTLQANDHKGGWENCEAKWLLKRLQQEVAELRKALDEHLAVCRSGARSAGEGPWAFRDLAQEAADVANFAMMIVDVCGELPVPERSAPDANA